ncbi:hypothetical protein NVIRPANT_00757 [Pantoea sp. Nvir]|nr:hypothetical protein NVIRPANT_00757 [Pantoea sp. Nvir]
MISSRMILIFDELWLWLKLLSKRISDDNMTIQAGNLAYVSLLALVPLIAVIFGLLSAFPIFFEVSIQIKKFIFTNFVPATGNIVQLYLDQFLANVHRVTILGVVGLIITSLLLMHSINTTLNTIWRCHEKRPLIYSFIIYWMILTLGPLLVGTSLAISSYLLSLRWISDSSYYGLIDQVLQVFPILLSWIAFWLLYNTVPTRSVPTFDALIGALVASLLFELGKKIFTMYVTVFPSYQLIYGVIAVIPLLFLWVYWTWCIVLLGAEITVTLDDYRKLKLHTA